jgi:hypothetical protein
MTIKASSTVKGVTANALLAEAKGADSVTLHFDGEDYELPLDMEDINLAFLEEYAANNLPGAMKGLIGEDAYKRFRLKHTKVRDMNRFFTAAQERMGGNS